MQRILKLLLKQRIYYEDVMALVEVGNQWSFESRTLDAPIIYVQRMNTFGL
jgi:hypothetical protein